jgi:hypothetical protein
MGASAVLSSTPALAQYTLSGNYLQVGVGADGSIINPSGTATPVAGQSYSTKPGIIWDGSGTGNFSVNNDFITPGTPFQTYSLGVNGTYGQASYVGGNTLGATTIQTGPLSTQTTGSYGGVSYVQNLSFGSSSSIINFSVTLTNNSGVDLTNVAFASGFDPDPDVYQHGSYFTNNSIVSPGIVEATGPLTGNSILIQDLTGGAVASIVASWPTYDPYGLLTGTNDGNGDYSIFDAWNISSLAAGASKTINYNYIINSTPVAPGDPVLTGGDSVPDSASTLALLGLGSAMVVLAGIHRRRVA